MPPEFGWAQGLFDEPDTVVAGMSVHFGQCLRHVLGVHQCEMRCGAAFLGVDHEQHRVRAVGPVETRCQQEYFAVRAGQRHTTVRGHRVLKVLDPGGKRGGQR
ncbi:hypothetical protein OIE68_20970 [Nocardia vinacea]|uniref:hypothetical protein n=1 Tax=Nocardia vinacea TaxID=96468 RepID=UPI002E0FD8B3|nr:hypothetical protein OIE68_20970 [Nocardia vinacea]